MRNLNKKASTIGTTLTWVIALVIILFILGGYFFFSTIIYKNKGESKSFLISEKESFNSEYYALSTFLNILNFPYDGKNTIVSDLESKSVKLDHLRSISNDGSLAKSLGVDCYSVVIYLNNALYFTSGDILASSYSEDKFSKIYFKTPSEDTVKILFYGGNCL